ncbi:MAG: PAS domain S-box protein [Ginsengibacter sp.]
MDQSQSSISILIIEDNEGDQLLLEENLKSTRLLISGITTVPTLTDAFSLLSNQSFSLIFLDLFLPDSAGLESFTELVKTYSKIPVIISSGLADTQVAINAISLGAQDFLIKSDYDSKLLEKTVRYGIERKKNLEIIEENIERHNTISKATNDIIWDWDLITNKVLWRGMGLKNYLSENISENDVADNFWVKGLHNDERKKVVSSLLKTISSGGISWQSDYRFMKKNGIFGYINSRGYISKNELNKPVRMIGSMQDITERKNAEQKVLLSEQRFKSLVQSGADLVAITDKTANYLYVSPTSKKILGYEPEFFYGKNVFAFIHPGDMVDLEASFAIIKTKKYLETLPFRVKNAQGEWRWMESSITNLMDDATVEGIVINSTDITDKKIAEDEIKKLSLVAKETINGVIITDSQQRILWVNNAFIKICGYELEEIIGKKPGHFLQGADTEPEVIAFIKERIAKKIPFVFEIINYTKSGDKIYLRNQIQPLFDSKSEVEQFFSLLTDITEQKLLEEKIALDKIIRQKEISEAVIAAHESERSEIGRELHDNVNQLLGAARLYVNMARKNDEKRDSLLKSSSAFTLKAIEEVRKLSKTLITPLIKEIGLTNIIKDLIDDIVRVHPVQIKFDPGDFSDDIFNEKFKLNLLRIVQEQLNNTIKHAHAGLITINIRQTNNKLCLCISDNGVGFDTTKPRKGVGISNIFSRTELYKGDVKLISKPGKGCSLSITFIKSELLLN